MINTLLKKMFGTKNEREVKRLWPIVESVNALEPKISALSDEGLRGKTEEYKARIREISLPIEARIAEKKAALAECEDEGEREALQHEVEAVEKELYQAQQDLLWDILPEAFAVVREASKRVLHMRHFDVQIMGGIALHEGKIAEMRTGEGKTLVATGPVYLNALTGRGVHVVTVNDYLARRDSEWMGKIYRFLGLTVGNIIHGLSDEERQVSYNADITYGTNNEFGFDYLRDNMKFDAAYFAQRELNFAIVDEVDSILVDEARTPLIISGPTEESTDKYYKIDKIIPKLKPERDYTVEEKTKTVSLTEEGNARVEELLGVTNLYQPENFELVHHVIQALRAHAMYKRDVDYVVKEGEVIIVDEFTGRLMPGRRWSEGLHQAVEAKEGVKIANENQTLATITFQNYFRLYHKLAGMTGTADTEAPEFNKTYNLEVMVMPTNRPMVRQDMADVVYKTEREKFSAVIDDVVERHAKGQPVLVGTISIEKSEYLGEMLKRKGIKHSVLNAKFHEREAEIVSQAGRVGGVTIATNMAGRGTDILLGGNPEGLAREMLREKENYTPEEWEATLDKAILTCEEDKAKVVAAGGLHIIGTERHESRRIDNQLRGRSGRQGDPGSSRFYLSLEDDLMRIFGSDRIKGLMEKLGMEEGIPIEHKMVTKAVENAQKKVEGHNFDIRKQLLEYDDVMNRQRKVIYEQRRHLLTTENIRAEIVAIINELVEGMVDLFCERERHAEDWDLKGLKEAFHAQFGVELRLEGDPSDLDYGDLHDAVHGAVHNAYRAREQELGAELMRHLERRVLLQTIDTQWKDHLLTMDHLKEGIGLRGYGQKDPLVEYKKEGFDLFAGLVERIKSEAVAILYKIQIVREEPAHAPAHVPQQTPDAPHAPRAPQPLLAPRPRPQRVIFNRGAEAEKPTTVRKSGAEVGRNDPCPCGSGKKYKKCCGA